MPRNVGACYQAGSRSGTRREERTRGRARDDASAGRTGPQLTKQVQEMLLCGLGVSRPAALQLIVYGDLSGGVR